MTGCGRRRQATAHDLLARLAVVPLVLEARGLDVTPAMIERLDRCGDDDERRRAANRSSRTRSAMSPPARAGSAGSAPGAASSLPQPTARWCARNFKGALKPPFNEAARAAAGLEPAFYQA